MLTFALFMTRQMPCRSGFPSNVLGALYAPCPDASRLNAENSAMAVTTAITLADVALFIQSLSARTSKLLDEHDPIKARWSAAAARGISTIYHVDHVGPVRSGTFTAVNMPTGS